MPHHPNTESAMKSVLILIGAFLFGIASTWTYTVYLNPNEFDVAYTRIANKLYETDAYSEPVRTARKADAVRLVTNGRDSYQIALVWYRHAEHKDPIIALDSPTTQEEANRLWFGIHHRYGCEMQANLKPRE